MRINDSIPIEVDILRVLVDAVGLGHGEALGEEARKSRVLAGLTLVAEVLLGRTDGGSRVDYGARLAN